MPFNIQHVSIQQGSLRRPRVSAGVSAVFSGLSLALRRERHAGGSIHEVSGLRHALPDIASSYLFLSSLLFSTLIASNLVFVLLPRLLCNLNLY